MGHRLCFTAEVSELMRLGWFVCFSGGVFALSTTVGLALAAVPEVTWHAPEDCPQAVDVHEGLEQLVGDYSQSSGATPAFAGELQAQNGRWRLTLTVTRDGSASERVLVGESCHEVTEAAIVVMAMTLDPEANSDSSPENSRTDAPKPSTEAESAPGLGAQGRPPGADAMHTKLPPRTSDSTSVAARAFLALDSRALPALAIGGGLAFALGYGPWSFEAHTLYLPAEQSAASWGGRSGEIELMAGGLSGCLSLRQGAGHLGGCLRTEAGALRGRGISPNGSAGTGRWWAGGLGVTGRWAASSSLALVGSLDAWFPFVRDEFVLADATRIHRVPSWTARATLGGEVRFR